MFHLPSCFTSEFPPVLDARLFILQSRFKKKDFFFFVLFCLVFFVASLHNSVYLRLLTLPVVLVSAVISVSMECAGSTRKPEPPRVTRS